MTTAVSVDLQSLVNSLPQTGPFRFIDQVIEIGDRHVTAAYRFRGDEFFYPGHFQGAPVTPGVILFEAMAQGGVVLQVLYLTGKSQPSSSGIRLLRTVLTEVQGEIHRPVVPPARVIIRGELVLWRAGKIRSKVVMLSESKDVIATATIAGMGVAIA